MSKRLRKSLRAPVGPPSQLLLDAPRPWPTFRCVGAEELESLGRRRPHGVTRAWENGWFIVMARDVESLVGTITHLFIRNRPNTPVRSWHDLQRIKNTVCAPDATAIEIFPPADDVIDGANMTHLWVLPANALPFECSLVRWTEDAERAAERRRQDLMIGTFETEAR